MSSDTVSMAVRSAFEWSLVGQHTVVQQCEALASETPSRQASWSAQFKRTEKVHKAASKCVVHVVHLCDRSGSLASPRETSTHPHSCTQHPSRHQCPQGICRSEHARLREHLHDPSRVCNGDAGPCGCHAAPTRHGRARACGDGHHTHAAGALRVRSPLLFLWRACLRRQFASAGAHCSIWFCHS